MWSIVYGNSCAATAANPHESSQLTRLVENLNYSALGLAATWPAEPKEGAEVEVFICDARMPQNEWRAIGKGVAAYESDR